MQSKTHPKLLEALGGKGREIDSFFKGKEKKIQRDR
jgi:hypothetical protein